MDLVPVGIFGEFREFKLRGEFECKFWRNLNLNSFDYDIELTGMRLLSGRSKKGYEKNVTR